MRISPTRLALSPTLSSRLLRRDPRDLGAPVRGGLQTAASGSSSPATNGASPTAHTGSARTRLVHARDSPRTRRPAPGRARESLQGEHSHPKEDEL